MGAGYEQKPIVVQRIRPLRQRGIRKETEVAFQALPHHRVKRVPCVLPLVLIGNHGRIGNKNCRRSFLRQFQTVHTACQPVDAEHFTVGIRACVTERPRGIPEQHFRSILQRLCRPLPNPFRRRLHAAVNESLRHGCDRLL